MTPSNLKVQRLDARHDNVEQELKTLREKLSPEGDVVSQEGRRRTVEVFGRPLTPQQVVEKICTDVRTGGLSAVLDYCQKLDGVQLSADTIRVGDDELAKCHGQAAPDFLAAVRRIRSNIFEFQRAIMHRDVAIQRPEGVMLRQRYLPIDRVGLCVPGGAAAYVSTVLMTAVPAIAAGVPEIAVVAPPTPFGADNPDLLAVCRELGVREVYRVGGAQGVAALAYGVERIRPVDKIVGPGNLFVALAKKFVYGQVDIDSIAGPSELVVIADGSARADFIAADLLAQAEHAPGASIFVTWSDDLFERTAAELDRQVVQLARSEPTIQSLEAFGALILVRDADQACQIANRIAPEHLHLACVNPSSLLAKIRHAGAAFVGAYSPVALGDYVAGPSHVLPTSGTARWASGLTVNDFLRSTSVIAYSDEAMRQAARDVQLMADKEGLSGHRASIDIRLSG